METLDVTYSAELPASVTLTLTGGEAMAVLRGLVNDAAYQRKACEPVRLEDSKSAFVGLMQALRAARAAEAASTKIDEAA